MISCGSSETPPTGSNFFCAAFFAYCLLDNPKKDRSKLWRSLGKVLFLFGVFLLTDLVLNALSHRFFILAGVGSWLSYLFGILLYAAIFPKYDWNARIVTGAAAFSIIITAFRLGAVFGRLLEFSQWHFNSLYAKLRPVWPWCWWAGSCGTIESTNITSASTPSG